MLKEAVKLDDKKQKRVFPLPNFMCGPAKRNLPNKNICRRLRNSPKDADASMKLGSFYVLTGKMNELGKNIS
ncbi:MAG: hypothetical protein MZV70_19400 [Desulfobacterales bacterium]|nr:hypothetical protein [Desulfobacterales bacterium]